MWHAAGLPCDRLGGRVAGLALYGVRTVRVSWLWDVAIFFSGFAWGWLVLWYWLVRPMAKQLGWEK